MAPPGNSESSAAAPTNSSATGDLSMGHDGKPMTPEIAALGEKIRRVLATYEAKHLNARDNSCWEVMHGLIAFGPRTEIYRDGPGGATVNAIGWLSWGARCQGQPLIVLQDGHPHGLYGVGLEGHDGQFLAMLAQWRVRPESPMHIGGQDFTVADLIEEEKATCQSGTELTFKLIALAHYLPSDAQWTSRYGEHWDIPKLIKAEIEAPIHGATCGGSHRLLGIANAVKERAKQGQPIDGQWARAAKYIADYQRYTLGTLQNPDGSFSTEWFNYPADRPGDIDRKLQTTGHMLEFIVWSLPTDDLRDPRVLRALNFLSDILEDNSEKSWSIGPLGHALHTLMVYHERMYNQPALPPLPLTAAAPTNASANAPAPSLLPIQPPPTIDKHDDANRTLPQLQRTAQQPMLLPPADKPSAPKELTSKELADQSDGCTDAVPSMAAHLSTLRLAMRDIISALAPPAGTSLTAAHPTPAPSPVSPQAAPRQPALPTDAPFDRPATSQVGP